LRARAGQRRTHAEAEGSEADSSGLRVTEKRPGALASRGWRGLCRCGRRRRAGTAGEGEEGGAQRPTRCPCHGVACRWCRAAWSLAPLDYRDSIDYLCGWLRVTCLLKAAGRVPAAAGSRTARNNQPASSGDRQPGRRGADVAGSGQSGEEPDGPNGRITPIQASV
jgi:hypothetical protein